MGGGGFLDHVVDGDGVFVPFFPVAPVFGGEFEVLFRLGLAVGKALRLLVFVNDKIEFHEQRA